jgi:glycosyltransferase involved in cell wall biosynthesis
MDLTIVTPSRWLADQAKGSRLMGRFPVEVIPNGIDLDIFKPVSKSAAREILGIDGNRNVILFGGAHVLKDRRKGAHFFSRALGMLKEKMPEAPLQVVVFGTEVPEETLPFHYESRYLGFIRDERLMALAYAAADIYVTSPIQENLANTVMEALACGTPTVAFDVGGIGEMVLHEENGYLARASDPADLARGIEWILERDDRLQRLSTEARETAVERFDVLKNAKSYQLLFEQVVGEQKQRKSIE